MKRVIEEMAKAKGDVERRYRIAIPEIIRECKAFAYLGKSFTFNINQDLENRVNERLISLSDEILLDIEERAKKVIQYANEEEDEDEILLYIGRRIGDENMVERVDKHCSTLRFFLEGWIAIGMVNNIADHILTNTIISYIGNPMASQLWRDAINDGYISNAIRGRYIYGKGNHKDTIEGHAAIERYAINEAYQYGMILNYRKAGAIGYRTRRNSNYDCPLCDDLTTRIYPLNVIVLPAHPGCVCSSIPVFKEE